MVAFCVAVATRYRTPASADSSTYYARESHNCHFSSSGMGWKDLTGATTYRNGAVNAVADRNAATSDISVFEVTTGAQIDVALSGATPPTPTTWGQTTWYCNFSTTLMTATANIVYFTQKTNGSTATERKQLMIHEFGHAFGLAHYTATPCTQQQMMIPSPVNNTCGYSYPRLGDAGGVDVVY